MLTGVVVTGKTTSGLRHQNGRGQKESPSRINRPALLLLLSLKVPEA